jgi:hypothetical protein
MRVKHLLTKPAADHMPGLTACGWHMFMHTLCIATAFVGFAM